MIYALLAAIVVGLYYPHVAASTWVYEDVNIAWWVSPSVAHAVNVALHLTVVMLLGVVARTLNFSREGMWLSMAVMAIHPITVETVAYAASMRELVMAIGVLLAVLGVLRWSPSTLAVGGVLALLAKAYGAVAIGVASIVLWWARPRAVGAWAVVACLAAWWALTTDVLGLPHGGMQPGWVSDGWHWASSQAVASMRLVSMAILPYGMTVDADIDVVAPAFHLLAWAGLIGMGWIAWVHRASCVGLGVAWCLVCLIPRLIVQTPRSYVNEHQFYVPLMGLIVAGVAWWEQTYGEVVTA